MNFSIVEPIRLVIWDMDETFWDGTLTEGGITYKQENHDIVVELSRRGIMNSICSKNNLSDVENVLRDKKLWEYFIFNSIDWQSKGERVRGIIENVKLRSSSVLFIDDNPSNLAEVKSVIPDINVASDEIIPYLLNMKEFQGKEDGNLSRLADYKILEKKAVKQAELKVDTKDFLRGSGIRVSFEYDVTKYIDRAVELINRTNQLNFTKKRLPEDINDARSQLSDALRAYDCQAALIEVYDNFGDYGFSGFYLLKNSIANGAVLEHFCFSCRTLGMGIEKWVYDRLGKPALVVEGKVSTDIFDETEVDWVNLGGRTGDTIAATSSLRGEDLAIIARGGCEMLSLSHYFHDLTTDVRNEGSQVYDRIESRYEHSSLIPILCRKETGLDYGAGVLDEIGYKTDVLSSSLFRVEEKRQVIVMTLWSDIFYPVYKHRNSGIEVNFSVYPAFRNSSIDLVSCGKSDLDPSFRGGWFEAAVDKIISDFDFLGSIEAKDTRRNLDCLLSSLTERRILIIIGINEQREDVFNLETGAPMMRELNQLCSQLEHENEYVTFIDIMPLVQKFGITDDPNHFPREFYYELSEEVKSTLRRMNFVST